MIERRTYITEQGTLDGAGAATLTIGPVGLNRRWAVERINTIGGGAANPFLTVYRNFISDGTAMDGTPSNTGNRDFADENSPLVLDEGELLILRYTGGTAAAGVTANVQYRQAAIRDDRRRGRRRRRNPGWGGESFDATTPRHLRGQHPTSVS